MAKKTDQASRRPATVRHGRLRRSSGWKNFFRVSLAGAIVLVLSGVATVSYALLGLTSELTTVKLGGAEEEVGAQKVDGAFSILLVGSDSRHGQTIDDGEEGELNDVNLMLHVSADHKNATVISFPRDLMLPIPSCPGPNGEPEYYSAMSEQQLNSTLGYGGLPCVVDTIEQLTGMNIPYAGVITFDGVIAVSNALGGVNVCLSQPIVDPATDLDLPAGENTLVGVEALQFLRTRYGVGDGSDTSRISNQQVFMSSLVQQMKAADTLSDPVKVYALAKAALENVTFSSSMATPEFLQSVASTLKDIDLNRINFVQFPTVSHPYNPGRLTTDEAAATTVLDLVKSGQPFDVNALGTAVTSEEDDATGVTPAPEQTPAEGEPVDQTDAAQTTDPGADQTATGGEQKTVDGAVILPDTITGLQPTKNVCSAGRTVY